MKQVDEKWIRQSIISPEHNKKTSIIQQIIKKKNLRCCMSDYSVSLKLISFWPFALENILILILKSNFDFVPTRNHFLKCVRD